jgi:hypothetical protein
MGITKKMFIILISSLISIGFANSHDNMNFYNSSHTENLYDTKTFDLYYDDGEQDESFALPSHYMNEPFQNGVGFFFDLKDFTFLKNVKKFKITEISVYVWKFYLITDNETVEVLCGGVGSYFGPKGPQDVLFAVPHGGITYDDIPYEQYFYWVNCDENDGSWGTDDGVKYDYNGLPFTYDMDKYRDEHGNNYLWVAKTQVRSDNDITDNDYALIIGLDTSCQHHFFQGENYNWQEHYTKFTCMIRLKIEFDEPNPGIENTSLGSIKSIFK